MDILGFFNSVLKIALGVMLAFTLYMVTVKLIMVPLISSGGDISSITSMEHAKEGRDNDGTNKEGRNNATLIQRMEADRNMLEKSLKQETVDLEVLEKQAARLRAQVDTSSTSRPEMNDLIDKLFHRTKTLAPNQTSASTVCSKESKEVLDAWLQFLKIHTEFQLNSVTYDKAIINELLLRKARLLNSLTPNQGKLFRPLTTHLLEYHKIITSKDNWQLQMKNLEMIANATGAGNSMEKIYELGYPKSDNPCFTTKLSLEISSPSMVALSNITLEKWFYTFWARRFSEETMSATYLGLKLLDFSMKDLE